MSDKSYSVKYAHQRKPAQLFTYWLSVLLRTRPMQASKAKVVHFGALIRALKRLRWAAGELEVQPLGARGGVRLTIAQSNTVVGLTNPVLE